jgi:hypothetical protein
VSAAAPFPDLPESDGPPGGEGRGAFAGFIGPRTLVATAGIAAPYLFDGTHPRHHEVASLPDDPRPPCERAEGPLGWWRLLLDPTGVEAQQEPTGAARTEYFALCLAAHHGTVATYVPTDVDAKIRHALWFEQEDPHEHARMRALAFAHGNWSLQRFTARLVAVPSDDGPVSSHDGERLSVWCGAMTSSFHFGWHDAAREFEALITAELEREARGFHALVRAKGREPDLLKAAAALTHNAGDINQALAIADAPKRALRGPRGAGEEGARVRARFGELATRDPQRFGGAFAKAAALYRELMAPEGHRHYPLRAAKVLRSHPDLLLPPGPFFDDWGERIARFPGLSDADRAEVVGALLDGCRRVRGQHGYYRALAGLERALPRGLNGLVDLLASTQKKGLKDAELRQKIAVPRVSFESSFAKGARKIVGN